MNQSDTEGRMGAPAALITPEGRRLAWTETGQGAVTLVFVHGWCGDRGAWRHQMSVLREDYRCVALDLAGHGATSPLPSEAVSVQALAQDVLAVLGALDRQRVVLIGHSLGGPVVVEAAIAAPQRIEAVIGVDTFTDERVYARRPSDEIDDRLGPLRSDLPGAIAGLVRMITLVDRAGEGGGRALVDELTSAMSAMDVPVAVATMRALLEWDIEARWPRLAGRVEAVNSRALIPLIAPLPPRPNLRVRLLEDVGHFPMMEDPSAFNALLRRVLDDVLDPSSDGLRAEVRGQALS